ncbi:siderophore-interacting protein [Trinickia caryophylli]|uniref:NADPH-dependent ferric siderophore reductase, contains FAD-binding and SIP domains n=1 Tax=Trinickia caryophylli TaxID=28094 RepID=A0A1X7GHQ4_TRICW|nr:siderophore-interacting protein [Trinickia caryophylli]PMS09842.1 siderophore-interacting protein [Trinickia caryophylli]TRX14877.1 siderophore-interacting protein [Trinickia caryophylli]WQE14726.1 siderophore-interacting protein [Trinickia caryophylli]SMF69963.1 NADPH-dependent ferric siderophore reductase, contains FAD-binding and SIP domains [Trinickia caryophylli]GLU34922.1 siderophore-interacting protein [Trinickia caryophylli]
MSESDNPTLAVARVRHPLKFRLLQIARVTPLNPHLVRITLRGDDLQDFESASFDDHVKIFIPAPGQERPSFPTMGPNGPVYPDDAPRPIARDFTPRRFDRAARELDLEFALHEAGPATQWASQAQVGQYLGVGGPRGSFIIPTGFDWHVLIGDETALPAIARRLEELPAGTRVAAVLEVASPAARISFETRADLYETWCYRGNAASPVALLDALRELYLPPGEGYVWAAGEAGAMRAVRELLIAGRGLPKSQMRVSAYWRRGAAGVHESLDD